MLPIDFSCLLFIFLSLAGCASSHLVKQATVGEPAVLVFQVLFDDLPRPMIIWMSDEGTLTPQPVVVSLRLDSELTCESAVIYVNPIDSEVKPLNRGSQKIDPILLESAVGEMNLWKNIEQQDCTVVLAVGTIRAENFTGVSASTAQGVFTRYPFNFHKDKPAKPSYMAAVPFVIFVETATYGAGVFFTPLFIAKYYGVAQDILNISFIFPDGSRKDTTITKSECDHLLAHASAIYGSCNADGINDWTRAALIKLRLGFKENSSRLQIIDGFKGSWRHDVACKKRMYGKSTPPCTGHSFDGAFIQREDEINWSMGSMPTNGKSFETTQ